MEKSNIPSSLQQKLQLLRCLREGKLEHSQKILSNLSKTSRSNQHIYQNFHLFLSEHRQQIQATEKEQRQPQQRYVIVDGGNDDDEWVTDDEVSLSSQQQDHDEVKQQAQNTHAPMKNISNSKSSALLHTIKDYKKPFFIQTKAKQIKQTKTMTNYSFKSRKSAPKLQIQNKSLIETISKTTVVSKPLQKHSKPYFPPINGSKATLKLTIK